MIATRTASTAALSLLLAGCGMANYEDVSSDAAYTRLIGEQLEAKSQLYVHAVTLDPSYAKRVDLYSVTVPPGFSGPEVIHRDTFPSGTAFQVLSVRRCTNCPLDDRVELLVHLNRPVFPRHLAAIIHGSNRGVYEQQTIHGRVQGRSGQAGH